MYTDVMMDDQTITINVNDGCQSPIANRQSHLIRPSPPPGPSSLRYAHFRVQWPEEEDVSGFKETYLRYLGEVENLSYEFVQLVAEALGLPPDGLARFYDAPERMQHRSKVRFVRSFFFFFFFGACACMWVFFWGGEGTQGRLGSCMASPVTVVIMIAAL